jgi:hypothetical protein
VKALRTTLVACASACALVSSLPAGAESVSVLGTPVDDPGGNVAWILDVQATGFMPNGSYVWDAGSFVSGRISWGDGSDDLDILVPWTTAGSINLTFNHTYGVPGSFETELSVNYVAGSSGQDCDGSTCVPVSFYQASTDQIFFNHDFQVSPIPEPETYAMLLAGLGLLGIAGRRRKLKEAAAA